MVQSWWPLVVLAVIQLVDAALCVKPVAFIRQCLVDVRFPQRFWRLLPPLKLGAAAGLVAGIWVPPLAVLAAAALVCYFVIAVTAHIRARDFGRNLALNATAMLLLSAATLAFCWAAGPTLPSGKNSSGNSSLHAALFRQFITVLLS